jgi:hypothetical protein
MLAFDSSSVPTGTELKILRITPEGNDVQAGRQAVFQFDRSVVPIGRMERDSADIPVTISPPLNCEWRWLNTSALACQLREEDGMKQATSYEIVMRPGITTENGSRLKEEVYHSFTTTRPKVTYTRFVNWLTPGTPLIQVTFNQPVTRASVEGAISLSTQNAQSSKPVEVIAYPDKMPRELPWWVMMFDGESQPMVNDRITAFGGDEARKVWVIEPKKELPLDAKIFLDIWPGLVSSEGIERGAESRTVVSFDTYPEFEFLGLRCTPKGGDHSEDFPSQKLGPGTGAAIANKCAPLRAVFLLFSSPVLKSMVKNHVDFTPRLDGGRVDYDPWANTYDWTGLASAHRSGSNYPVMLPERLQAAQAYKVHFDIEHFTDEFGRKLAEAPDFTFSTAHREADLDLDHYVAVLEKGVDSDVPLYVTNLKKITVNYDKLGDTGAAASLQEVLPMQPAEDIAYATPLEVRKLIGDDTGILYGSLHPDPLPPIWYRDPEVLAQVTPFQVHFKVGHFNSQVWVTSFDDGQPVPAARVTLLKGSYENLPGLTDLNISATTDGSGLAEFPGLAELDPELDYIYDGRRIGQPGFFVKVEHLDDIAVLPLNQDFSIMTGGAWPRLRKKGGHTHTWGTTAQGLYKLGDKVQFKIYIREQSNKHWVAPSKKGYSLQVFDPQSKIVYEEKEITLNEFGAFAGEFKVLEQGAVGWYQFKVKKADQEYTWTPMSVLISDFTPSPFKVKTELNGGLFAAKDQVVVTSLATMHSGGPFTDAEVRLTAQLTPKDFSTDNPVAKGFTFGGSSGGGLSREQRDLLDVRGKLDDFGQYENAFTLPETGIYFGTVVVESAVKDARGKFVASSAAADFAGRSRFVGLRNTKWLYEKGHPASLEALVVDQAGELVPEVEVSITIKHREYKASRVKGPGNAYLTKNIMEWVKETDYRLKSAKGPAVCKFTPEQPGYYQFVAAIKDEEGREHRTTIYGWAVGSGVVVWDQSDDATLQIVAEQSKYKIGDTARYLIKNPYPGAKALISVERYGILDSWVQTLETSTPVIEVPVKPDYLPGFYLSVVVVSPRVDKPLGEGKVDLGKPSYRMGYVSAAVADPYKEIEIEVSTDRKVYKPRETVKAAIRIKPKAGDDGRNYELAVAVVDESVLAMNGAGEDYYDPYAGFNRLDSLDLYNYSLISRLVGRQKFEKKGANPGGGGGAGAKLRNLFNFVSYWNPSITPGADGRAEIEFELPDNLTGWRIFVLAVDSDDRMGLGDVNFKVNRPTEIRPVMPNQVIEGDSFKAGFEIMNRTDKARSLEIEVLVEGPLAKGSETEYSFRETLAPFKRQSIWLPLNTKGFGELKLVARAGDRLDADAVEHQVPVNKRRSLETAATYGTTTSSLVREAVKVPEGIFTDVGSISTVLSPSVLGNLDGAFAYIREYPYMCWEQRLTKAIVANSYVELREYLDPKTTWPRPGEDVERALGVAANFQAPNGGMVYWIPANSYVSPYLSAYTAIGFNWLRRSGYPIPSQVETRLHDYLLTLLRRNEFPTFYSQGMSSSVRAVALAALAESGKISAGDVQRYESHVPEMDLFGKAHFLQAAIKTAGVDPGLARKVIAAILGQASQTGGKFQFNEPWDDSYKYILATPLRSNCAVMSSLLAAQRQPDQGTAIGDIPFKLARSLTQSRGNRDHWENTQENVFCMNALIDYASMYENEDPDMRVEVSFDGEKLGRTSFTAKTDPPVEIGRAIRDDDPGRTARIEIDKQGPGRLYYAARIAYDLTEDNASRINSGLEIRREYSVERDGEFVLLASPMSIDRGELVKVDLFVSVPTARHFVVVNDPIPGGLEPVNTDLATASKVDADKGKYQAAVGSWFYNFSDWTYYGRYFRSFYHQELRHDSARFYADYLPAGSYHLSYTAQAIAAGNFTVMPVLAEEMYDPDVYGKGLPATLNVGE